MVTCLVIVVMETVREVIMLQGVGWGVVLVVVAMIVLVVECGGKDRDKKKVK